VSATTLGIVILLAALVIVLIAGLAQTRTALRDVRRPRRP